MSWTLVAGDCVEVMAGMEPSSIDAVVTDPPYGLEFMGKEWDRLWSDVGAGKSDHALATGRPSGRRGFDGYGVTPQYRAGLAAQAWHQAWASEALRILKPGGHLLSFGGTRTYHRLVCALEDAGFEIRDCLAWLYGSGFPKSLDVSKAIDKAAGVWRGRAGEVASENGAMAGPNYERTDKGEPVTPDAERWQGWGTALKPAFEPIVLARKPLSGTVAENVLRHGTGALNVDGTRIGFDGKASAGSGDRRGGDIYAQDEWTRTKMQNGGNVTPESGRWPANVLLDADAAAALDEQSGELGTGWSGRNRGWQRGDYVGGQSGIDQGLPEMGYADSGGASRFFYTAKTSRAERENGVAQYGDIEPTGRAFGESGGRYMRCRKCGRQPHNNPGSECQCAEPEWVLPGMLDPMRNNHPTVKPVDLMQWLCRLITPPQGLILDPFTGSGSTGIAALREGFSFIGIEREPDYVEIARARIIGDAPLFNVGAEA